MRVQISYLAAVGDGREHAVARSLSAAGIRAEAIRLTEVYIVDGIPALSAVSAADLLCDGVAQEIVDDLRISEDRWDLLVEITYRPGVSDPVATSLRDALQSELGPLPSEAVVQTARQFRFSTSAESDHVASALHNPLIQNAMVITREQWDAGVRPPPRYPLIHLSTVTPIAEIDVASMNTETLENLNTERLLALSAQELVAIRDYYKQPRVIATRVERGLPAAATDVELEMIAQTWSEHCKHKIFAARIEYRDEEQGSPSGTAYCESINGLFSTYIRATTENSAPRDGFLKSVFHDNSGVIEFDEETLICFKAETHNSPSALDPYGGAITGIVGVNRDILGTGKGARPIFNTNVLCFGTPDTDGAAIPQGLLHPRAVLEGVHHGIVDGGNQSGIPVIAGAFLFDESYLGKPLVFCGTGGILPATIRGEDSWVHHVDPGDFAVMVGGRIGKDGIHGATFSSLALDEASPTSAVQIGEPITQKKMLDFLLEARDQGLYKGITDNGAGGLSSSLGEMARESGGVEIDLAKCPLKYAGLAPWEILLSESQERMSLAVDPSSIDALLTLATSRGVEATVVGQFTSSGAVIVGHGEEIVAGLDIEFLHDGVPQMELEAVWPGPRNGAGPGSVHLQADLLTAQSIHDDLLALLADPNIASKEHLVRQYDHEVQGASVIKPFCGRYADGPTDGGVIRPRPDSARGATVTHGICPRYGDVDAYKMAMAAVDEAVRAHVALGGDPDQMAALDNFCWPDPVRSEATPDGAYKLAQLVRSCKGLAEACRTYHLPLISGKDSMKNDASLGGVKVSIRPTLLISLLGIIPDVNRAMTPEFKRPGDLVLLVGQQITALGGTAYERLHGSSLGDAPSTDAAGNIQLYQKVHQAISRGLVTSVHDCSDGGLAVALAECVVGGRLGADVTIHLSPGEDSPGRPQGAVERLFGEATGQFVVGCREEQFDALSELLVDLPWAPMGVVTAEPMLRVDVDGRRIEWTLPELLAAWSDLNRQLDGICTNRTVATPPDPVNATSAEEDERIVGTAAREVTVTDESPTALVITGYGINADLELAEAFRRAGARVERVHVNDLLAKPSILSRTWILAFPGGFSYGDHVGGGMMLAHRLRSIRGYLDRYRASGRLTLGICNGFQVLVKMGILPDTAGGWHQEVSLVHNDTGVFEDSWVTVEFDQENGSPWLNGLSTLDLPIRHGEGRLTAKEETTRLLEEQKLVALRYVGRNPNGSFASIAGITDTTRTVLGMMPHPEAALDLHNHPHWFYPGTRCVALRLFDNAVAHVRSLDPASG
jgi:phosphoribosylformylglycinamidine synthase II